MIENRPSVDLNVDQHEANASCDPVMVFSTLTRNKFSDNQGGQILKCSEKRKRRRCEVDVADKLVQ